METRHPKCPCGLDFTGDIRHSSNGEPIGSGMLYRHVVVFAFTNISLKAAFLIIIGERLCLTSMLMLILYSFFFVTAQ